MVEKIVHKQYDGGFGMIDRKEQFLGRLSLLIIMSLFLLGGYGCSGGDSEELYQQGVTAMEADKPDEAIIWFKKALQVDPESGLTHYKLGMTFRQKGNVRQALGEYNRALLQDPQLKEARKSLAFLLVEAHALEQVAEVCGEYLEINGDDEEIYILLGNALAYSKKIDKAIEVMQKAAATYPDSIPVQVNLAKMMVAGGKGSEGRGLIEKVAKEHSDDIQVQMALVQVYQKIERFDLAVMVLEEMKKRFTDSPLPYLAQAQLALKKAKPARAKEILQSAEEAGINDPGIFRLYAMISHRQGEKDTALSYFEKAVKFAPAEQVQLNKMILVDYLTHLKKYKEAQEALESIIAGDEKKKGLKSKVVELFLAQGEYEQARTSVEELLKENAGDARGHFLKGLMMMKEKEIVDAREQFSKAKELAPESAENQFLYGLTFMDESQDISITEITEALKKNPEMVQARMALAELLAKKGDYKASLDEIDKVITKRPDDLKVRALRVSVLLAMKKPDAALIDAKFLMEKEPDVSWHVFRLAEIYFQTKAFDKALPLFLQLREVKPESVQLLNRIVGIYMLTKEPDKAMDVVDSYLSKNPDNSKALVIKAKVYLSQGYRDLAENVLVPVAAEGKDADVLVMLAELYRSKKEDEKTLEYYTKALQLLPKNIGILMKIADFYLKNGNNTEAIHYYEMILQEKDDFLPAMNNLAYLYGESGEKLDRALELATKVAKLVPDSPDVADTLGWIYVKKKAYSQAEPYFEKAYEKKPDNVAVVFHLAVLRYFQNKRQDAKLLLEDAIAKGLGGSDLVEAQKLLVDIEQLEHKRLEAIAAQNDGATAKAIGLFEEILAEVKGDGISESSLAMLYVEQGGDTAKAMELAQKSYNVKPKDALRADALGWIYYYQGSLLLAKKYVEEALQVDESYGPAWLHLGAIYLKKEDVAAAAKALERAEEMTLSVADRKQLEAFKKEL